MSNIIDLIESEGIRKDIPDFQPGDTVRVFVKVVEGNRERLQAYEGLVIARKNGGIRETFTVRRISYGVGVERTFPRNYADLFEDRPHRDSPLRQSTSRKTVLYP